MNNISDFKASEVLWSSFYGGVRGVLVHTLICPFDVVKIRQQCAQEKLTSYHVALNLFRQGGIGAFYKGLFPQLVKTSIKQLWCWPLMTELPFVFQKYSIGILSQQALTGLTIATIDAGISTPLEKAKVLSAFKGKNESLLNNLSKEGWRGGTTHWFKLSVNWMTFLTLQKYLRDKASMESEKSLSCFQLSKIGIQVAFAVSLVSAPFDIANTLKQAQNLSPSFLLNRQGIFKLYRGWPLHMFSLVVHNIASITLLEKLKRISD